MVATYCQIMETYIVIVLYTLKYHISELTAGWWGEHYPILQLKKKMEQKDVKFLSKFTEVEYSVYIAKLCETFLEIYN